MKKIAERIWAIIKFNWKISVGIAAVLVTVFGIVGALVIGGATLIEFVKFALTVGCWIGVIKLIQFLFTIPEE